MLNTKKALSPIIAVMLLLMVSVASGSMMFKWYEQYTSDLLSQGEVNTNTKLGVTKIQDLIGTDLYFRNGFSGNITISDIKIGNKSCGISTTVTPGMTPISLNECSQNLSEYRNDVVIYTDKGVFNKYLYFNSGIPTDSNPVVESLASTSFQWYNYTINNSLRFNDDDSAYLSRTPKVAGNRTTWTWSGWVKRGNLGLQQEFWSAISGANTDGFRFDTGNSITIFFNGGTGGLITTTPLYRDPSEWTHLILSIDTTQTTASDRVKLYVNGKQITSFSTTTYPTQNYQTSWNNVVGHALGRSHASGVNYYDGYLSEVNFVDGQALNTSYFGEFNDAGKWTPKQLDTTTPLIRSSNRIPTMTNNTAPSGTASAGSSHSAPYDAWKAMDDDFSTYGWISSWVNANEWIAYEFTSAKTITAYAIQTANHVGDLDRMPKDFTFEGYNGGGWDVLDTQTNEISWSDNEKRIYTVSSPGNYSKYRLYVSTNNGDLDYIEIDGFELFETVPITYGTNGFYLPFNNTNILGEDYSPIENNITEDFSQGGLKIESDRWNGDTLFLDTSGNKHPITAVGNTIHSTTNKMFGDTSIYFDGNGDYLQIPDSSDWKFGTGNFTIDFWVKNIVSTSFPFGTQTQWNNPYDGWNIYLHPTGLAFYAQNAGTSNYRWVSATGKNFNDNAWHHIAIVRDGNLMKIYVDGIFSGSEVAVDMRDFTPAAGLNIGRRADGASLEYLTGYLDKFRITKGKALWISDFAPEKAPNDWTANNLDETGGLLIHSNATTNYSQTQFKDESGQGHVITTNGQTHHSLKTSKFDNSAISFDGTGDYLTTPNSADWNFGSGNFTIDFWINANGISQTYGSIITSMTGAQQSTAWNIGYSNTADCITLWGAAEGATGDLCSGYLSTSVPNTGWHHIAFVRNNSNGYLFIDGIQKNTKTLTGSFDSGGGGLYLGRRYVDTDLYYLNGFIDEIRISKGIARWTTNFTPPTSRHTTDANTKLLIHSDYNEILDSGEHKHQITINGDVKHSTDKSKFGTSSLYFDGTGDYLSVASANAFDYPIGTDFTIDAWLNFETSSGDDGLFVAHTASTTNGWQIYYNTGLLHLWNQGSDRTISWTPTFGTWYHLAIVRSGTTITAYVDGNSIGTFVDGDTSDDGVDNLYIGTINSGGTGNFQGYMDEVRITKGKALWTTNFTPDTQPATRIESYSTDVMIDTPTNNFATLNNLRPLSGMTYSEGNLKAATSSPRQHLLATMALPNTGKTCWEITLDAERLGYTTLGVAKLDTTIIDSPDYAKPYNVYGFNDQAQSVENGVIIGSYSHPTDRLHWNLIFDADNNVLSYYAGTVFTKNITGLTDEYIPYFGIETPVIMAVKFQNRSFKYLTNHNCSELSTNNLPSPAINISKAFFDVLTYTGNDLARNITGLNFTPDLVWLKGRDVANNHNLYDILRGTTKRLSTDSTGIEDTPGAGGYVTSFDSNGFSLAASSSPGSSNDVNKNYVAWNWKESQTAGIDIVNYTGSTAAQNVAHNLNATPDFVIFKSKSTGTTNWQVYHSSLGIGWRAGILNGQQSASNDASTFWTGMNSTHFSLYGNGQDVNVNEQNYIAYLFKEVKGFSKIGKYVNNNNADGPFIYTEFKPKYILIKTSSAGTSSWYIYDSERSTYNPVSGYLLTDSAAIEGTSGHDIDILSNGFKLRTALDPNYLTRDSIYIAFAEYPFR